MKLTISLIDEAGNEVSRDFIYKESKDYNDEIVDMVEKLQETDEF